MLRWIPWDHVALITCLCSFALGILIHWDLDGKGVLFLASFCWINPAKFYSDHQVINHLDYIRSTNLCESEWRRKIDIYIYIYIFLSFILRTKEIQFVLRWGPKLGFRECVASYQARVPGKGQTNRWSLHQSSWSCSSRKINWEWYNRFRWFPDLCFSSKFNETPIDHHHKREWRIFNPVPNYFLIHWQIFPVANTVFQDPHYVIDFKPENQWVQTKYMYLLGLVETLSKPPQSLSATELSNAQRDLTALKESGFKLDWLNSKLEEVSLEWKKAAHSSNGSSGILQLEERVENVELSLSDVIVELDKVKLKSAAAQVSSFQFIDFLIKRFFLSCFSFSKS